MTYNGWTNYETWAVGLYLDGNYDGEGTYRHVLGLAAEASNELHAAVVLADDLKDFVSETVQLDVDGGLALDLLRAALSEVNWQELAEAKLAELKENES